MQSHIIICVVCCRSLLQQFLTAGFHAQVCETCEQFGSWQRPSLCLTEFGVLVFSCAEVRRSDWGVGERSSSRPEWPSSISRTGWGTLVVVEAGGVYICSDALCMFPQDLMQTMSPETADQFTALKCNTNIVCVWLWKINQYKLAIANGSLIINATAYGFGYNTQAIEYVSVILARCDSDTIGFP